MAAWVRYLLRCYEKSGLEILNKVIDKKIDRSFPGHSECLAISDEFIQAISSALDGSHKWISSKSEIKFISD